MHIKVSTTLTRLQCLVLQTKKATLGESIAAGRNILNNNALRRTQRKYAITHLQR